MKTQHRHELQQNQLADWLESSIEKLKPYASALVGVLVAVAIIIGVYMYVGAVERRNVTAAADQFISAIDGGGSSKELEAIVEDFHGTQAATLAQLKLADMQLRNGTNLLYSNKPLARESLANAARLFAAVDQSTHDPMLRAWSLFGAGRAHESLGDLDKARTDYQNLVKDYPDSGLVESARIHLSQLSQPATKEFYDWFAKQDPRPPAADKEPGIPGVKPSFDFSEPLSPDGVKLPSALDGAPSSGPQMPADRPADSTAPDKPADSSK
jgi:tetratricopeptide (TPR) repeat protein